MMDLELEKIWVSISICFILQSKRQNYQLYTILCGYIHIELNPKTVAKAFWVGEVEHELRRLGKEDFRFHGDEDLDKCMEMIEDIRRQSIYPHPAAECSTECRLIGLYIFKPTGAHSSSLSVCACCMIMLHNEIISLE